MKKEINIKLINELRQQRKGREVEYWDTKIEGFVLRKRTSGNMFYYFAYTHQERLQRIKLGEVEATSLEYARDKARELRGQLAVDIDPKEVKRQANVAAEQAKKEAAQAKTYLQFLDERYRPWLEQRPGFAYVEDTYNNLKSFVELHDLKLDEITVAILEDWRTRRRQEKISEARIKRQLNDLHACFEKIIKKWKLLKANPLNDLDPCEKEDKRRKPRYASEAEEQALRDALDELGDTRLTTAVILSLNTGVRRGELLKLKWSEVDFKQKILTIIGKTAKSKTTRHVSLNSESLAILDNWKNQQDVKNIDGHVFTNDKGQPIRNLRKPWEKLLDKAKIKNFHWHCLRHTCASRLVQRGVDLYTVKAVLGHSDFETTERYAHLSSKNQQDAMEKLVSAKISNAG